MGLEGHIGLSGHLTVKHIKGNKLKRAPLSWRLKNSLRLGYIMGLLGVYIAKLVSGIFPVVTMTSKLEIKVLHKDGTVTDYGVVSRKVVTDAGVAFIVDGFDNTVELEIMNYHGLGTGGTAEAANQTALVTECTTALNPNSTRATGTQSQPSANIYRSVGTLTFDTDAAVTEHGLFSQSATGGGTMLDRSLFSAINVVGASGDSIQATYSLTLTSGS